MEAGKTISTDPSANPSSGNESPLTPGQVLKGYEVRALIARGGFGAVYRAYQPIVDREVALKVILPEYANHPNFIRRFEAEAQLIAHLEHIHVVPLYDYWREPSSACLVMRWLRGGSLQDSLDRGDKWPLKDVARLLDQVASALAAAHRIGVVHRDLKPGNILLDEERNAYLADFGIAKKLVADPTPATAPNDDDRLGSPAYISPEQVMGQGVSAKSDIYSLGMVLYMLLTGQAAFIDPSTTTVIRKHVTEPTPPLQLSRPDLPHSFNMVIWRATSKQPENRYGDALSMAAEFRSIMVAEGLDPNVAGYARTVSTVASNKTVIVDIPAQRKNPYRGLQAFQEGDASDFYGRQGLINRLVSRLGENEPGSRFLAVVGPSGSGKSSVVKAGLIPAIRRGALFGSQDWFIVQMMPGAEPFLELEAALLRIAVDAPWPLLEQLRENERSLFEVVKQVLPFEDAEVVLVIDQFEELFTLVKDEGERTRFLNSLVTAVTDPDSRLRVIMTLRADFYDRPLLHPRFGDLLRQRMETVLPMTADEMQDAIVLPAESVNCRYEPGLVAQIISDVNQQPGALPLLQYALTELFDRTEGVVLTTATYKAIGGVFGSLASRADELYESLDATHRGAVRQLFLRLVRLGDSGDDTRRRVLRSELIDLTADKRVMQEVIDLYGKYRLLTFDYEPTTRAPTVEVAHEALIRDWGRLRQWLDASRDDLRLQQRLAQACQEWINNQQDASYLASGSRLAQFEALMNTSTLALNPEEKRYLQASIDARQRATNRLRLFIAGLAVFAFVALALALFAFEQRSAAVSERNRADTEASISRSRELAVTALTAVKDRDTALLLSIEALNSADTFEARNSLLSTLQTDLRLSRFLHGHSDGVRTVATSADGRRLVSGARDGSLLLWDTEAETAQPRALAGHSGAVNTAAFSPDGQIIASGSSDGMIRFWDANTAEPFSEAIPAFLTDLDVPIAVWSVAFHPNGQTLAAGYNDGLVRLWNVESGELIGDPLTGHTFWVSSVAFSPDGSLLASGDGDWVVRLWNVESGEPVGDPLTGHSDSVLSVTFSPDGQMLASSGADAEIILWDVNTQAELGRIPTDHAGWVRGLAFNPDGSVLATASWDDTIRLWDVGFGEMIGEPLRAHSGDVWSVAFKDEGTLISGGADGKLIVWDVNARQPFARTLSSRIDGVASLAYSPDGRWIAAADGNLVTPGPENAIRLWDAASGEVLRVLKGHTAPVTSVEFSPDGRTIASGSADRSIRLWDANTGELKRTIFSEQARDFIALAFSPDGQTLASGTYNGDILLWNAASGELSGEALKGHQDQIMSLAFSHDGKRLVSGSMDDTVRVWDAASRQGRPLSGHTNDVTGVAFSPDGRIIASSSVDNSVRLWDTATGEPLGEPLIGHSEFVHSVAFSPDGRTLASAGIDAQVLLWDVETGRRLGLPFTGHTDWIMSLAFSPDGRTLASGSLDATILLWDVAVSSWQERACRIANRSLSAQEWQQYFQNRPYHQTC